MRLSEARSGKRGSENAENVSRIREAPTGAICAQRCIRSTQKSFQHCGRPGCRHTSEIERTSTSSRPAPPSFKKPNHMHHMSEQSKRLPRGFPSQCPSTLQKQFILKELYKSQYRAGNRVKNLNRTASGWKRTKTNGNNTTEKLKVVRSLLNKLPIETF